MGEPASDLKVIQFPSSGALDMGWDYALLPEHVQEVSAVCLKVEAIRYGQWDQRKKVLTFQIVEPIQYSYFSEELDLPEQKKRPVLLSMFVREELRWKRPPLRSKLRRLLYIAQDGKPSPHVYRISQELFLNKLFRCRVGRMTAKESELPYSYIDTIEEKLAGA